MDKSLDIKEIKGFEFYIKHNISAYLIDKIILTFSEVYRNCKNLK